MNPDSALDFFARQLARAARGLELARASRDTQLGALNFRQMFKGHLMRGLVKWRQRRLPAGDLEAAVRVIVEARSVLGNWDVSFPVGSQLPLGSTALLARLLDMPYDCPGLPGEPVPADVFLDLELANTALGSPVTAEAQALIHELRKSKRTALAGKSYDVYFRILASSGNPSDISAFENEASVLFSKRAQDSFYKSANQTEGGGADNALVVDYRLGFVLKTVRYSGDSVHAWAW